MIYLDNAATTPPEPEVLDTFSGACREFWANPHSLHRLGERAESLLEQARSQVTTLLVADSYRIVFTSGATEANNLAIKGTVENRPRGGGHVITTNSEHPSVARVCDWLETHGLSITRLPVGPTGSVSAEQVRRALTDQTVLVTTILVNNESGAITPAQEIADAVATHPARYHVDAVQAVGKLPLAVGTLGADMVSLSAHKFGGLKGSGVLLVRERLPLPPQMLGGGQEAGVRSGTVDVPKAAALAKALRLATADLVCKEGAAEALNQALRQSLTAIEGVSINSPAGASPYILNMSVAGLRPETILHALAAEDIFISTVSACSSGDAQFSQVVHALTGSDERARTALRISISAHTTREQISHFIEIFPAILETLR